MKAHTGEVSEKSSLLRNIAMFSSLSSDELKVVATYSEFISVESGEFLFSEGELGDALYVIESGRVVISQVQGEGKRVDIAEYIAGECFGEIDILYSARRNASARTEAEATLLRFPRRGADLPEILEREPAVSARLLQKLIVAMASRIRATNRLISQNSPWVQQLRQQVFGDKLTGMYNRSYLDEELPKQLTEEQSPFALLMVKPDNFKLINDTYGHDAGDATLRLLAATVRRWADKCTSVRFRGNEMTVLLPRTPREQAIAQGETLRRTLCHLDLEPIVGEQNVEFNFSVGIAMYPEDAGTAADLVRTAHETLFAARDRGANRTMSADEREKETSGEQP